jgi:VWFA-related protein
MNDVRKHYAAISICCAVLCLCVVAAPRAQQTNQAAAQGGDFKISVGVNSVLVPVVVRDSHGRGVGDLTQKDFELFDQDKPRPIAGFSIQKRAAGAESAASAGNSVGAGALNGAAAASATSPAPTTASDAVKNAITATAPVPATSPATPERFVVFLFDDMHFDPGDLLRIRNVATKMLGQSVGDSDMAAVVTTSGTSSGLTRDRAVLQGAVEKLTAHPLYQHDSHACPNIGVYEADLIVNKHNVQALEAAEQAYSVCAHVGGPEGGGPSGGQMPGSSVGEDMSARMIRSAAAQVVELGDRDVSVTLSTVKEFVRRMGKLPGQQHTLILVSPGFVTVTPNSMREKSEVLDLAARANVTISALDARGLYTTNLDASEHGAASTRDMMTGETQQYHSETMNMSENVMSELANGTGGTFFHNNNDLAGGFALLGQAPEYVYLLEMSLDKVRSDGAFHRLKVKVNRDNVKVESRHGYVAPQPPPKQKK